MACIAPPCVIDIEASGFGRGSYPVEVGYAHADGRAWCTLVSPAADWLHWDDSAEQVHGISRAMLASHGRPPAEVARRLNEDLAGLTVYTDAWGHDYAWLARLFDAAGTPQRFRLEAVSTLLDASRMPDLDRLRQQAFPALGIVRHRASSDARALQWALGQLR
ncbi:3'-5' exonuclease [Aquabacterium sp. OR-4]|uniref:3'-5' exonuclease n=1 Tax=Aquabacterium sp. OR-4 TaxID=2978127 RepID=UPI0021B24979|nr:hypothetical protein [Aquabacterium sp. OR-4]MDT7836761.1 hypothetical protein [Aquabacterium sp. OR-4]